MNSPSDNSISGRFSASADTYEQHAAIQRKVADRVSELAFNVPPPQRILEIGCGTGLLTRQLYQRWPQASITALDLAHGMLERAKQTLSDPDNIHWQATDICSFKAKTPYDIALGSSSLHWANPIGNALDRIADALKPGGRLFVGLMLEDTLKELHQARLAVAPGKPPATRLPQFRNLLQMLEGQGWKMLHREHQNYVEEYTDAQAFLQALHRQGLTGGHVSRSTTPLTRGELMALTRHYDANFRNDQGYVTATYSVGYWVAERP